MKTLTLILLLFAAQFSYAQLTYDVDKITATQVPYLVKTAFQKGVFQSFGRKG
ncbi:MAG: hypothetical protein GY810_19160 [Aureispira sp.]|nr:hypothetical protein [Aureispira sp.]